MKKGSLLILVALLSGLTHTFAQSCGILLYNENGKKFKVYTNGNLQNNMPMSEVKLCCFPMDIVKVKLEFEDNTSINKTLYLRTGFIEHHKVTDNKIIFDSYEEMTPEYRNTTQVTVVNINTGGGGSNNSDGSAVITTTTASSNCRFPMSDKSFYTFYGSLKNKSFDSDRLTDAKNAVKRDCFTSKQIKNTLAAFTYESSRLEFAKFAYDHVHDKGAYSAVKEGFNNSLSGDELDAYINRK